MAYIVGLTAAQLRAEAISVTGTVAVTGTFWQATQPISGTITVGNASLPVTGTFWQATQPVSIAATVAVSGPLTDAQLRATPVPVSGTVTTGGLTDTQLRATALPVSLASVPSHAVTLASTTITNFPATQPVSGTVTVGNASLPVTGSFFQATQPVSIATMPTTPVTGTFFQATQPVSGTVTANAGTGTMAVSGTFWQATQPVSGPLTDTQLRASAVPVSMVSTTITGSVAVTGTFWQATQPVSLATNTPDVTDRAARLLGKTRITDNTLDLSLLNSAPGSDTGQIAIPVRVISQLGAGGGGGSGGLTNTELRASPVPTSAAQSGTWNVARIDATASGTIAAISQSVSIALNGKSGVALQITGTWVGTLQFEGTVDGSTWAPINGVVAGTSTPGVTIAANGIVRLTPSGLAQVRITSTAWTSGTASIAIRASDATGGTFLNQSLTAGSNLIGKVGIDQTTPGTTNLVSIGTNGTVVANPPTITKGTQGATGVTTQDLKDAGRNARSFMLDVYTAAPAAEALQSVVQYYNGAAVAGTTTPAVVPAGKTLRLTSWALSTKSLATVGSAVLRMRVNTAGVAAIGSPLVWSMEVGSRSGATTVAMTGGLDQQTGVFPEGFEIPAGAGIGFTLTGYGPTGTAALQGVTRFQVYGYEY